MIDNKNIEELKWSDDDEVDTQISIIWDKINEIIQRINIKKSACSTDNKTTILSEINQYLNTIVLSYCDFTLYRLMGFYEDTEDYYYNMLNIEGAFSLHSCVMGFIPLKNKIDDSDYKRIENVFELNQPKLYD